MLYTTFPHELHAGGLLSFLASSRVAKQFICHHVRLKCRHRRQGREGIFACFS